MKTGYVFLVGLFLTCSFYGKAQQPDTLIKKLDSLTNRKDSSGGNQVNNISSGAYNENTKITLPVYFILLGSDFKQQLTSPFHLSKKGWINAAKFTLITGGLALLDETIQKNALDLRNNSQAVRDVSKYVTRFGGPYEGYTLGILGAYSFIFKKEKVKTTTLLATQAYITGAVIESAFKFLTGRQRPNYIEPDGEAEPRFHGPSTKFNSFPSGHTTVAFAAATVFAKEYKNQPFIPILSYSVATLIGMSRVTENKHWATDVLVGGALGYLCGRQVVNNYHRYAKLKAPNQKQNSVSFNLHYFHGQLQPGIVYSF